MSNYFRWKYKAPLLAALGLFIAAAHAQDGYHVSEDYQPDSATADAGPVRMARISLIEGSVSWRPGSDGDWSAASINLPLRQGSQIWVSDHARAEIQFDDGSYARIGSSRGEDGGVLTLQTLYSDSKGEFTELGLNSGLLSMRLTNGQSLYQVDTGALSAKAYGPAKFRVGVSGGVEVVDRTGEISVQNSATQSVLIHDGESIYGGTNDDALQTGQAPREDSFDAFVDSRDRIVIGHAGYVPANIAVCAGDLGDSGAWHPGQYGQTWYPRVEAGWSPYHNGHWVFVRPFGWTWCADESWGWAPYHYGTWVSTSYGWGWVPGPAQQCWSPAVVHFTSCDGRVAWCPLAPSEVRYASIGINFGGGFSLSFSIGSVGCYYPANNSYCSPHTFNNVQVNRVTNITNITTINNYYGSTGASTTHFVPVNARSANGASYVASNNFGGRGTATTLPRGESGVFERGTSFSGQGGRVLSGPPGVQVSHNSFTPTHTFTSTAPPANVVNRPLVRHNVPSTIGRVSTPNTAFVGGRTGSTPPPIRNSVPKNFGSTGRTPTSTRNPDPNVGVIRRSNTGGSFNNPNRNPGIRTAPSNSTPPRERVGGYTAKPNVPTRNYRDNSTTPRTGTSTAGRSRFDDTRTTGNPRTTPAPRSYSRPIGTSRPPVKTPKPPTHPKDNKDKSKEKKEPGT